MSSSVPGNRSGAFLADSNGLLTHTIWSNRKPSRCRGSASMSFSPAPLPTLPRPKSALRADATPGP